MQGLAALRLPAGASPQPQLPAATRLLQQLQQLHASSPCSQQQRRQQQHDGFATSTSGATAAADSQQPDRPHYPSRHERRVAHLAYCQQRAAWRRQVKQLRLQWLAEHRAKVAAHKAATQEVKQQIAALREARDAGKQQDRRLHALEQEIRAAQLAVDCANRRAASAYREELRQQTLQKYRQQWRAELEEASRSWIPAEELEGRITAALDNPAPL